ncbi:transposase [Ureibacillus sp. FSL W8-0352]|uniref:transposase n=1 Tax=Ureibacillus sp. FSL W8-0352 TaxID=2954596 RepID=UPI0030F84F77
MCSYSRRTSSTTSRELEPVFGFLKAILGFTRFSVRGKFKVKIEMGIALMATNLRKYALRGV